MPLDNLLRQLANASLPKPRGWNDSFIAERICACTAPSCEISDTPTRSGTIRRGSSAERPPDYAADRGLGGPRRLPPATKPHVDGVDRAQRFAGSLKQIMRVSVDKWRMPDKR